MRIRQTTILIGFLLACAFLSKAQITNAPPGLAAKGGLTFQGNFILVDSYDSSDSEASVAGLYDFTKARDNALVYGALIDVGNATVNGFIATSPSGAASTGPSGAVGDAAWVTSNSGVEPGHSLTMSPMFPDVVPPLLSFNDLPLTNQDVVMPVMTVHTAAVTYPFPSYPPAGAGAVITNSTLVTASTYPITGVFVGAVTTNTTAVTSSNYPGPGTFTGPITTNFTYLTNSTFPTNAVGGVTTNFVVIASTNFPANGTYVGNVATNTATTFVTQTSYPEAGTYIGSVMTNATVTTSIVDATHTNSPAAGTFLGGIITNTTDVTSTTQPSPGTYVPGTLTSCQKSHWCYTQIDSYTFAKITSYTFSNVVVTGYTYSQITSYTYSTAQYSFFQLGYAYNAITGYTVAVIQSVTTGNPMTNHYDYVFDSGAYQLSTVKGLVLVRGEATVYVPSGGVFSAGSITIASGGRLVVYCGASAASLNTTVVVATNFFFYGLPSNTSLQFNPFGSVAGCFYAPSADVSFHGGGNYPQVFTGTMVCNTLSASGRFNIHIDEALAKGSVQLPVASNVVFRGASVDLVATTNGFLNPFIQWYKNGIPLSNSTNISGTTTLNLHINSAAPTDAGEYTISVGGARADVFVQILEPVLVTPVKQTNWVGFSNVVQFVATPNPASTANCAPVDLTYQWFRNGLILVDGASDFVVSGSQTETLTLSHPSFDYAGNYTVQVTCGTNQYVSSPAQLTVIDPAIIHGTNLPSAFHALSVTPARSDKFGFTINGGTNLVVIVEASTNLATGEWIPVQTNFLSGSTLFFEDVDSTNFGGRFYRLRSP